MKPQQPNNNTNPTRGITAEDLKVGGKYVPHSKSVQKPYSMYHVTAEMENKNIDYISYKGFYDGDHVFYISEDLNSLTFLPSDVTPYHEPNECCGGYCPTFGTTCILDEPNQTTNAEAGRDSTTNKTQTMNTEELKDNKIMLLEEDLWCVHRYLDDLKIPRVDKDEKEYSIVGRIKRLEERYLKQMSEIETQNLSNNYTEQPFNLETALKHPEWVYFRNGEKPLEWHWFEKSLAPIKIASITSGGSFLMHYQNGFVNTGDIKFMHDLILRVPYVTKWFNVYKNTGYLSKEEADSSATLEHRIACVPVKISL